METHIPDQFELEDVPIIDFQAYFNKSDAAWESECKKIAQSFHQFGIAIVRDPRVTFSANDEYIDMMERYFEQTGRKYYAGEELEDMHPELSYQTGTTHESIERARNHQAFVDTLPEEHKPLSKQPPEFDCKWRFFWPIGERPAEVNNDLPKVYPKNFPEWEQRMDGWGNFMIDSIETAAEMVAIGLGVNKETFTDRMKLGAHLLSPTGSDLEKYSVGTTFAGFHYDLNFITAHGKSRYPGLWVWKRDKTKMACKIPEGCLLMQAGIMFEWITGGYVLAGFHEVVYTQATKETLERLTRESEARGERRIKWRVSSTLFSHLRYDVDLSPLPELASFYNKEEALRKYFKCTAFEKLIEELKAVNLCPKQSYADKPTPRAELPTDEEVAQQLLQQQNL